MNNLATTSRPNTLPAPMHPDLDVPLSLALSASTWSQGTGTIPADRALAPVVVDGLRRRRTELAPWLTPADPYTINQEVAGLFNALDHFTANEVLAAKMQLYANDLEGVPRWALTRTCAAFRQGSLGDGERLPTAGAVRLSAMSRVQDYDDEARRIDKALALTVAAPSVPINLDRKAAMLRSAREFVSGARAAAEGVRRGRMSPQEIADARAISAALSTGRDTRPMPKASPALRRSLGLPEPIEEMPEDRFAGEHAA